MTQERPNGGSQEHDLGKVVQMPPQEEILRKLQDAGLYGLTSQTDTFFQRFSEQAADHEIVGAGLNMAWELAGYDTLRQYPSVVRAAVNAGFDRAVDAITPDPEVAEQAKAFRRKVLEEAERQRKAAEPTAEDLGVADSLKDFDRYTQARKVGDIVFEQVTRKAGQRGEGIWMEDWREQEVNPFYRQTHRGFFLEQYYSSPSILWTPWGEYHIGGSGSGWPEEPRQAVLNKLGVTLHKPEVNNEMGTIGPIYAVHEVDGVALPNPIERPRSQFAPYEEVKTAWKSLTQQYRQSQGRSPRK